MPFLIGKVPLKAWPPQLLEASYAPVWHLGYRLIKFNETWHAIWLFIWLLWRHTRPKSLLFQFLYDPFANINSNFCNLRLLRIIRVGIVISLNRYKMQTFSARGLQVEICEKEEKRLGTNVLPWQQHELPKIFIRVHPLSVPSFIGFY
jgi:hypothetical protein